MQEELVVDAPAEAHELERLHQRLAGQFPIVEPADIEREIKLAHSQFEHARVRQFIPVLIERHVRLRFATRPGDPGDSST